MQIQKPRQGYKFVKSLFGKYVEIPKEWEIKTFDDVFEFLRTGTNARSDLAEYGDIQYVHYGDIHAMWNSILDCDLEKIPWIDKTKVVGLPLLKDGDLIIVDASEDYGGSGTSILLKNVNNKKIVSGLHTIALRSIDENISPDFKTYITSIKFVKNQIIGFVTGVSVYGLSKNNLKKIRIPLPTLPEQQKIASILSNVDSLIQQTQKEIEQTQKLKKGLMQKLLTKGIGHTKFKKLTIGNNSIIELPIEWNLTKLDQLAQISTGSTPSTDNAKYYKGNIPFIQTSEIQDNIITKANTHVSEHAIKDYHLKIYPKNTVLLAMYGQGKTRGRTAILDMEATITQNAAAIVTNEKLNSYFLLFYFLNQYNALRGKGNITQISHLNLGFVKNFRIPLPPISEQQTIISILSNIQMRLEKQNQYKSTLENLKKGLMQKLLTGQIRVKV